jgi:glycosidase
VAPGKVLITETNVPHEENISYFGRPQPGTGRTDEAQLVYQFPLAPLIMHSLLTGDAQRLSQWAAGLETPAPQAMFFNFTASHDGIGVMPARGLLSERQIQTLVDATLTHGGRVSYKTNADGSQSVYELNISYFDALSDPNAGEDRAVQVARFVVSQAIMLSLAGLPGIYVHSLLGSQSWQDGVARTGRNRSINRQKFDRARLEEELAEPTSTRRQVLDAYSHLLRIRAAEPAFHPQGRQRVLSLDSGVFALTRTDLEGNSHVLCLHNVAGEARSLHVSLAECGLPLGPWRDLITDERVSARDGGLDLSLPPYAVRWYKNLDT